MMTAVQYLKAQKLRTVFVKEMRELFKSIDVFLTPTMSGPAGAPEYASSKRTLRHMFNVCGFPAMAIPVGFSKSPAGLPLSLQIAARPFEEERIYAAAFAYESQTQWYRQRPQI
jgi:aspartyl-tRNA(Asn)/glutamyl-tRNA(Gln) amidotransferase subunit A